MKIRKISKILCSDYVKLSYRWITNMARFNHSIFLHNETAMLYNSYNKSNTILKELSYL